MVYGLPPWIFKGKALYQLQLVKSEEARKYVPPDLKLVELFGYTLGGFYLARYTDSPAGAFDELVVLGGLAWKGLTSCAWAARVYVNSRDARDHGLKFCGLPSRIATFTDSGGNGESELKKQQSSSDVKGTWWQGMAAQPQSVVVHNTERRMRFFNSPRGHKLPVCTFNFNDEGNRARGPRIKMSLPSFSGCTPDVPDMLEYSLQLHANISLVRPVRLTLPDETENEESGELLASVLRGKPLVALSFGNMMMEVESPKVVKRLEAKALNNRMRG